MAQSGKEHSCCCQKLSHEVSGDGDKVADLLNPHGINKVAVKWSKLGAKAVAKDKLEAKTGGKDKSEGENKKDIGRLIEGMLVKLELLKLIKEINSCVDIELNKK